MAAKNATDKSTTDKSAGKHERDERAPDERGPRPFWSGSISFGLVTLPVSLFAAARRQRVALRMIDADGQPLARRYFCPRHEKALAPDDIVRGYEVEEDRFVVVEDDELDAIAPAKSREMDLRRFVPVADIDPMYFQRAYFLAPDQSATKSYRLLAKAMEDTERAGIATCVIRGNAYLLALLSSRGILRVEVLRFADELRSPADVGLESTVDANAEDVERIEASIHARHRQTLDRDALTDAYAERLEAVVDDKLANGDVIAEPDAEEADAPPTDNDPIDLMAVLKERLSARQSDGESSQRKKSAASTHALSRDELYARAQALEIAGRSRMNKAELAAAVNKA